MRSSPYNNFGGCSELKITTKQLIQTSVMARWIMGLGVFEYPFNRPRLLFSIFYASSLISLYLYYSVKNFQNSHVIIEFAIKILNARLYNVLSCIDIACCLFIVVNVWCRMKMWRSWYKRVDAIRKTMNSIGCNANKKSLVMCQYVFYIFIFVYGILGIYLSYQEFHNLPLKIYVQLIYCIFYAVLVISIVNAEFSYSVWYISSLFGELNTKLSDMLPLRENQQVRVEMDVATERHHLKVFNTIRRLHLELVRISLYVNDLCASQNLMMIATSTIMITAFLFEIYDLSISNRLNEIYNTTRIMVRLLYFWNIIIVNLSCARATDEAHRTGSIITKLYSSISNKEFHSKIRQFTLQLIQTKLLFKVCGLFNLGRRLFTMIISGIMTYLVILIQAANLQNTNKVDLASTMTSNVTE